MNVHLRNTKFWLLYYLLFVGFSINAQNFDPPVTYEVVQGQSQEIVYTHIGPSTQTQIIQNLTSSHHGIYNNTSINPRPQRIGSTTYRIIYNANAGSTGLDTLTIGYFSGGFQTYRQITFNVVPSVVEAKDDFIAIAKGATVSIAVDNNDFSNRGTLNVTDISVENNGNVTLSNNVVTFSPNGNFEGLANFNYVVCDDVGTCDKATVHVCVGDPHGSSNSTINLITKKNNDIPVFTPLADYSISKMPSNGIEFTDTVTNITYFGPNSGFFGTDEIEYTHNTSGIIKTVSIDVLDIEADNQYVKDDLEYSLVDELVCLLYTSDAADE